MLRWLRFALYVAILVMALARNASGVVPAARALFSPMLWAPTVPCVPCAMLLVAVAAGYAFWLAAATIARWRMPVWSHVVPLGMLVVTLWRGPMMAPVDPHAAIGPADRAIQALKALDDELLAGPVAPCDRPVPDLERALQAPGIPTPGYRSFGSARSFRVALAPSSSGPVRQVPQGAIPGTVYVACDPGGRRFWLTATVMDVLPRGQAAFVRDGVSRVVVLSGEVTR